MAMTALTSDRIRELYATYRQADPWQDWYASYRRDVDHFAGLNADEFRTTDNQRRLWRAVGLGQLGSGESVTVPGAHSDPEVVEAFVSVRSRSWPDAPNQRARAIQDEYDRILALVHPRHTGRSRPLAKLGRAFAALLPGELNTCFNWKSHIHVTELVLGHKNAGQYEGAASAALPACWHRRVPKTRRSGSATRSAPSSTPASFS